MVLPAIVLQCCSCGSGLADYTWASQLTLMLTLRKLLLVFLFGSMCLSISTQNFCIMDEHNNNAKKIFFFFQLLASSYGDAHAVWNVRTKRERLKKNTTRKGGESGLFGLYSGRLKAALV